MAQTTTPVEILEERWKIATVLPSDEWTKVMVRLDKTLAVLYEAVARREWTGQSEARPQFPGFDGSGSVTEDMHNAIHDTLIASVIQAEKALATYPTVATPQEAAS